MKNRKTFLLGLFAFVFALVFTTCDNGSTGGGRNNNGNNSSNSSNSSNNSNGTTGGGATAVYVAGRYIKYIGGRYKACYWKDGVNI